MKACHNVSVRSIISFGLVLACVGLSASAAPKSDTEGYGPLRDSAKNPVSSVTLTFTNPLPEPATSDGKVPSGQKRKWAAQKGQAWYFVDGHALSFDDYESHYSGNDVFALRSNKTVCSLGVFNDKAPAARPVGSLKIQNPRLWYDGCGYAASVKFAYGGNTGDLWCHTTARAGTLNKILFMLDDGCIAGAHTPTLEDIRAAVGGHFSVNGPQSASPAAQAGAHSVADTATVKTAPAANRAPAIVSEPAPGLVQTK